MNSFSKAVSVLAIGILASSVVFAQQPSPEERAVSVRQAVFTLLGSNMGPIGAMVRGRTPFDAETATKHVTRVSQLSLMITDAFTTDTRESGIETEALDVVWENMDDFEAKAQALTDAANTALAAIASGDEDAAKGALGGIGRNCGGCHDDFREED